MGWDAFEEGKRLLDNSAHALILLEGKEGEEWAEELVDKVEWTNPNYCHQN